MSPRPRRVAVVDIGSNSTRLFLCSGADAHGPAGAKETTITALRRGAAADGTLHPDSLARLDGCLEAYGARVASFGADEVVPVATSAVRDAPNRGAVEDIVRARLGAGCEVLSGDEEAALAYAGARLAVEGDAEVTVLDVGGGSTEVVHGGPEGVHGAVSLQLGGVRCTEDHLHGDPPTHAETAALAAHVAEVAGPAIGAFPRSPVVAVAGTATTLAAILIGRYHPALVHGMRIDLGQVTDLAARLGAMTLAERRTVPGLEPARAPVIVAGALIVGGVLALLGADGLVVSERDILDGVALRAGCGPSEASPEG